MKGHIDCQTFNEEKYPLLWYAEKRRHFYWYKIVSQGVFMGEQREHVPPPKIFLCGRAGKREQRGKEEWV